MIGEGRGGEGVDFERGVAEAPLFLGYALGYLSSGLMALWVGAMAISFDVAPSRIGMIASFELSAVALTAILLGSVQWTILRSRHAMAIAVGVSIASNLLSWSAPTLAIFTCARIGAGLSNGIILAEIGRRAAVTENAARTFRWQMVSLAAFSVLFFAIAQPLQGLVGPGAPFLLCAGVAWLLLISLVRLPSVDVSLPADRQSAEPVRAGIMVLLAGALLFCVSSACWAYLQPAAAGVGITPATLSRALIIASMLNLLGPVFSGAILRKCSTSIAIGLGLAGMALAANLIGWQFSVPSSLIGSMVLQFFVMFTVPIVLTRLALIDAAGRLVAVSPAFFMIGSAVGPALGGFIISRSEYRGLAIGATVACLGSYILIFASRESQRQVRTLR
jgi:predicted MFS family arabinose efflux permease